MIPTPFGARTRGPREIEDFVGWEEAASGNGSR
jgi:hypothetical protein